MKQNLIAASASFLRQSNVRSAVSPGTILCLLLTLGSGGLVAQVIYEADRVDPIGTATNSALAGGLFGTQVALGFEDNPYFLVGSPGNQGFGHRIDRSSGVWDWTVAAPWESPHSAVATYGALAVFGHEPTPGDGRVQSFALNDYGPLLSGLEGAPGVLAVRPGVIAVGLPDYGGGAGRVRTYHYDGLSAEWLPDPPLDGVFFDALGASIALNSDGSFMAVGAPGAGSNGAVEVYAYTGLSWTEWQTIVPPADYDSQLRAAFGASLSLLDNWLAVGAPDTDRIFSGVGTPATDSGAVVLYEYDPSLEYQFRYRVQDIHDEDHMGTSVALGQAPSGRYVLATGVPGDDVGASGSGTVKVFERNAGSGAWVVGPRLHASDAATNDALGTSVSMAGDRVVSGSPNWDYCPTPMGLCFSNVGSVYVFDGVLPLFEDGFESGDISAWQ